VVAEVTAPDGKKSFPFGETPKGILIFTADGRFAQIHIAGDVPKIASNNRLTGTPEEYAEIMRRSLSVFGTYTVDEAGRRSPTTSCPLHSRTGRARRRPAPSTSSPRTNSSTPIENVAGGPRQREQFLQAGEVEYPSVFRRLGRHGGLRLWLTRPGSLLWDWIFREYQEVDGRPTRRRMALPACFARPHPLSG
jgi:hypothetical protein